MAARLVTTIPCLPNIQSYDYGLDKVKMFTRVPLGEIVGMQKGIRRTTCDLEYKLIRPAGAYILSTLNQGTLDPANNYGFVITYRSTHQDTRVTSYSVRNQAMTGTGTGQSQPGTPVQSPMPLPNGKPGKPGKAGKPSLSQILSNVSGGDELVSVAFKSLPVDPARWQIGGGRAAGEGSRKGPETCKEAVEGMVMEVKGVCEGAGVEVEGFITDKDIVRCVLGAWVGLPGLLALPRAARRQVANCVCMLLVWQKRSDRRHCMPSLSTV